MPGGVCMVGWPCMEGGHVWWGEGHALQGACMAGACVAEGVCGQGVHMAGGCMAREMATAADGTHPT